MCSYSCHGRPSIHPSISWACLQLLVFVLVVDEYLCLITFWFFSSCPPPQPPRLLPLEHRAPPDAMPQRFGKTPPTPTLPNNLSHSLKLPASLLLLLLLLNGSRSFSLSSSLHKTLFIFAKRKIHVRGFGTKIYKCIQEAHSHTSLLIRVTSCGDKY